MSQHRRLQNELKQIENDLDDITKSTGGYVQVFPTSANGYDQFQCVIQGPNGSPYDGGIFFLTIRLPADYPIQPPRIQFDTPIWHPNVTFSPDGKHHPHNGGNGTTGVGGGGGIHLDILKDQWSPAWTLQHILLVIWSLLMDPGSAAEAGDPNGGIPVISANPEATRQYRTNPQQFINTAQQYTRMFAGVETSEQIQNRTIDRLVQMMMNNCPRTLARSVLERNSWNEDAAVTELLLMMTDEDGSSESSYSFVNEFSQLQMQEAEADAAATGGAEGGGAAAGGYDDSRIGGWVNVS